MPIKSVGKSHPKLAIAGKLAKKSHLIFKFVPDKRRKLTPLAPSE